MTSTLGLINLPERLPELREHRCAAVRYEGNDKGRRQTADEGRVGEAWEAPNAGAWGAAFSQYVEAF